MSETETKRASGQRHGQVKIAIGDAVQWGSGKSAGVVQAIRIIESGKFVQSFCGNGQRIVLTISDGIGTAFIQPEDGTVTKIDPHEADAVLRQYGRKHQ